MLYFLIFQILITYLIFIQKKTKNEFSHHKITFEDSFPASIHFTSDNNTPKYNLRTTNTSTQLYGVRATIQPQLESQLP